MPPEKAAKTEPTPGTRSRVGWVSHPKVWAQPHVAPRPAEENNCRKGCNWTRSHRTGASGSPLRANFCRANATWVSGLCVGHCSTALDAWGRHGSTKQWREMKKVSTAKRVRCSGLQVGRKREFSCLLAEFPEGAPVKPRKRKAGSLCSRPVHPNGPPPHPQPPPPPRSCAGASTPSEPTMLGAHCTTTPRPRWPSGLSVSLSRGVDQAGGPEA